MLIWDRCFTSDGHDRTTVGQAARFAEGGFCDVVQAQSEGPTWEARDTSCSTIFGLRSGWAGTDAVRHLPK